MRILFITFLIFVSFQAFSQGPVDRIELGYQSTRRGIVWVRPGLPTHEPVWRISRDTNSILWHNLTTGIRYDWSYESETWNRKDVIYQTLPPLETLTSGLATINNTTADWINDNGISHFYDNDKTAWVPHGMSYQSASPVDIAAGVSNAAATYTTTLWQDSDDFLIRYWDGDSWELIGGATNLTYTGTSSPLTLNSSTGTDVTHTAGTGISLTGTTSNMTITNTAPDQTVSITGGGINVVTGTYPNFTVTGTEVDGSITNEGSLTVGAGTGTTSIINSNTSGSTGVTLTAGTGLGISEVGNVITLTNSSPDQTVSITNGGGVSVSGTYPNFTLTATDASATNEAQTLSVSGTTSGILSLNAISGVGGGTATIAAGTGIAVAQSGGTITITNSSPATAGWLLDGNTITTAKRIGSNDNFDVVVETNGTDRLWFDNAGTVSLGATQLTTAQFNINTLGSTNIGMLIAGGGSLVGPTFYSATGSGSGSTATVFSGVVSMISGNVEALIQNTATSGTGGALLTLNVDESATGDAKIVYTTAGTTDWAHGIDNSASGEPWRLTNNTDIGSGTSTITANTSRQVGVNQNTPTVQLQVTGTDGIGFPQGTTAQRPATPAFPVLRWNSTFSGFEVWDPNKNYWYRLTAVSTPTVASNTAAGTGHSANVLAGELNSDVRGVIELNTGSASMAVGTVVTVTYASAYSGTKTVVLLDAGNDLAATQKSRWRVDTQSNTGFTIRAVTALDINSTYVFKYYVGQ